MVLGIEFGEANIIPVGSSHEAASTIVPLVRVSFHSDGEYIQAIELDPHYYGTAFCISRLNASQAVYLTAQHTIEDLIGAAATNIAVMVPSAADPETFTFVPVHYWGTREANNDIAAFVLDFSEAIGPPASMPMTIGRWDFSEPRSGQNCVALGYGSPQPPPSGYAPGLHASRGTIEEVHPQRRDTYFVNYPSFLTNAEFPGGMSGGPVFTDDDRLIALVSTGGMDRTTSYASLIQAATALNVAYMDPSGLRRELHIGDLVHSGQIGIGSSEAAVQQGSAGVRVSWDDIPPAPELTPMTIAEEILAVYGPPAHDLIHPIERVRQSFSKHNNHVAGIRPRHAIQAFKDGRIDRYTFGGTSVVLAAMQIDTSTPHTLLAYAKDVPERGPATISFAWRLYTDSAEFSPTQLFDQVLTQCGVELTCGPAQGVFIARASGKDVFKPVPVEARYMTAEALIDVNPAGVMTVAWAFAIDLARYAAILNKPR